MGGNENGNRVKVPDITRCCDLHLCLALQPLSPGTGRRLQAGVSQKTCFNRSCALASGIRSLHAA